MIPSFQERNEAIRRTKLEFNDKKLEMAGYNNNDDHGWIPLEPFEYTRYRDEKSGLVTGMDAVSRTFAAFLDAHPVYIHPMSAIAAHGRARAILAIPGARKSVCRKTRLCPKNTILLRAGCMP